MKHIIKSETASAVLYYCGDNMQSMWSPNKQDSLVYDSYDMAERDLDSRSRPFLGLMQRGYKIQVVAYARD